MTISQAKKIVKNFLDENNLHYTKLTGKTIRFTDLARASCIFIRIHGWWPRPEWAELETLSRQNGFRVEV